MAKRRHGPENLKRGRKPSFARSIGRGRVRVLLEIMGGKVKVELPQTLAGACIKGL
jgi:hypothetical protein